MSLSVGRRSSNRPAPSSASTVLPEYEPPSCPLHASARKALGDLSSNRGIVGYEAQLKESVRFLGHSVGDLNERLLSRKARLAQLKATRERKGTEKQSEEEGLEDRLPGFEKDVESLTAESEQALRQIIDRRAELEEEAAVLGDLFTTMPVAAVPSRRDSPTAGGEEGSGDADADADAQEPLGPGLLETFRKMQAEKRVEWRNLSPHERYSLNNDYIGFKKLWHDAAVGPDGPPLPDASKWFLPDGEPDMSTTRGRKRKPADDGDEEDGDGEEGGEEDEEEESDDDDIAIQNEKLSMNCPLTLRPMKEPYKNSKCPHVFEKSAIMEYLDARGEKQCPQTGCSQSFSRARFNEDFSLDEAMLRRIRRKEKQDQEALRDMDDIDDDDDDDGRSMVVGMERHTGNRTERLKSE